jgi:hypothetical protein
MPRGRGRTPAIERLLARIEKREDGCWEFWGATTDNGYGVINIGGGRTDRTHRVAYAHFKGEIRDGLVIDHRCLNKLCCNPDHLEMVTRAENARRQWRDGLGVASQSLKTHCPHGHAYDEQNTYRDKVGKRQCRACNRFRAKKRREKVAA